MNEPENFLSRWSRRKREPEEAPKPLAEAAPEAPAQEDAAAGQPVDKSNATLPEPVFDPATLPPLDSIGAETDISAFLKAGVPSPLRLAALRRAWSADPAIRDFKGLAEYDWDFTATDSMPGFGDLEPGTDVQKMLTQIFGEIPRPQEPAVELPKPAEQIVPAQQELSGPPELEPPSESVAKIEGEPSSQIHTAENKTMLHREENIAPQNENTESDGANNKRRRAQGSALPQ